MDFDIIFQLNGFNKNRENKIMNTHETYVSFEIAKLLKEAGFDWECTALYGIVHYLKGTKNIVHPDAYSLGEMDTVLEDKLIFGNYKNNKDYNTGCAAPTLAVAQKWLREVKKCYVSIVADCDSLGVFYHTRIIYYDTDNYHATYVWEETELERVKHRAIFDNYEEALEAGIKKALEMILKEK